MPTYLAQLCVTKRCLLAAIVSLALGSAILSLAPPSAAQDKPGAQAEHAEKSAGHKAAGKANNGGNQSAVASGHPRILEFGAAWCVPCKAFAPVFAKTKAHYAGKIDFESYDIDKPGAKALTDQYQIVEVPQVLFLDSHGKLLARHRGNLTESEFLGLIKKVLH